MNQSVQPGDSTANCPRCGVSTRSDRLGGLCPRCISRTALRRSSPASADVPAAVIGVRFGGYELLAELGRGAMGAVYRARDLKLGREVALKLILAGQFASEGERRRFLAEAGHGAHFDHPNIVSIYQSGETDGRAWFAMKLIEGPTLAEAMISGRFQIQKGGGTAGADHFSFHHLAALISRVSRAVQHAHERGVLHRDLKPGNILLDQNGEPHVTDFGLARQLGAESSLTVAGSPVGTPSYMAPELARGDRDATTAADVWSLGAILYELLSGRPPFTGDSLPEVLRRIVEEEPRGITNYELRITNPGQLEAGSVNRKSKIGNPVPRDLQVIALKCLRKEPGQRYATAAALADDLDRWLRGEPIQARAASTAERLGLWARRKPAVAALVTLGAVFVLLLAVGGPLVALRLAQSAERERVATTEARERLFESLVAQARGHRLSLEHGRREAGLKAVREAARLRVTPQLRDEAIALLAATDLGTPRPGVPEIHPSDQPVLDGSLQRIALLTSNRTVNVQATADGRLLARLPPPDPDWYPVGKLISPDGRWLIVGNYGQGQLVFDVAANREVRRHPDGGSCIISGDSRLYALVEAGRRLVVRELATGTIVAEREGLPADRVVMVFAPTAHTTRIAFATGRKLTLWNWAEPAGEQTLDLEGDAWHVDWAGSQLAVGLHSGVVWLHDLERQRSRSVMAHRGVVSAVRLSRNGEELLTWSYDGTSTGWDVRAAVPWLRGSRYRPEAFADDGRTVALRSAHGWHLAPVERPGFRRLLEGRGSFTLQFSRDGRWLVSGGHTGLEITDVARGRTLLRVPLGTCTDATPLAGGRELLVTSRENVTRWEFGVTNGRLALLNPRVLLRAPGEMLEGAVLAGDGRSYLVPTFQRHLFAVPLTEGGQTTSFDQIAIARSPTSTPDGRWLATGTFHGYGLELRGLTNGAKPRLLARGNGHAYFSPDGRWLAWAGRDTTRIYETGTWREAFSMSTERTGDLPGLAVWSANSRLLAVTRQGPEIVLLDADDWRQLALLRLGDLPRISRMVFSPNDRTLAVLTDAEQIELWRLDGLRRELSALGIEWPIPESRSAPEPVPAGLEDLSPLPPQW
jgi:serine/threonine protein kinase